MLLCLTIGLMIGWPLLRLSQRAADYPVRQTLLDLTVLLSTIQVVLWPLRLVTPWSIERTAVIDATLVAWLLLTSAFVAAAIGSHRALIRTLTMVICIALCLAGPMLGWLGTMTGIVMEPDRYAIISPLTSVHRLAEGGGAPPDADDWLMLRWIAITVVMAWIAVLILPRRELIVRTETSQPERS